MEISEDPDNINADNNSLSAQLIDLFNSGIFRPVSYSEAEEEFEEANREYGNSLAYRRNLETAEIIGEGTVTRNVTEEPTDKEIAEEIRIQNLLSQLKRTGGIFKDATERLSLATKQLLDLKRQNYGRLDYNNISAGQRRERHTSVNTIFYNISADLELNVDVNQLLNSRNPYQPDARTREIQRKVDLRRRTERLMEAEELGITLENYDALYEYYVANSECYSENEVAQLILELNAVKKALEEQLWDIEGYDGSRKFAWPANYEADYQEETIGHPEDLEI